LVAVGLASFDFFAPPSLCFASVLVEEELSEDFASEEDEDEDEDDSEEVESPEEESFPEELSALAAFSRWRLRVP
jgi:hypothetical protein